MPDRKEEKARQRAYYAQIRERLNKADLERNSRILVNMLYSLPLVREAKRVMLYAAKGGEVDILPLIPLLEDEGIQCYIPSTRTEHIVVARYDGRMKMVNRVLGIREPEEVIPLEPAALDVILAPGVAFDDRGGRLGQGGGYYDRLFAETDALRVGICHEVQITERVPREEWDIPMDLTLTEEGVLYKGPKIHRFHLENPMI
ncbi:5-formyltetrahydrofolate cyclo-ligase [Eubacteriales bacterium OttesenSCG-928-M02]|nr:5-formyltetrahydrofolate cyclo-ligase [Eubacteriales bacterium OttesenSCG-928-M02]